MLAPELGAAKLAGAKSIPEKTFGLRLVGSEPFSVRLRRWTTPVIHGLGTLTLPSPAAAGEGERPGQTSLLRGAREGDDSARQSTLPGGTIHWCGWPVTEAMSSKSRS